MKWIKKYKSGTLLLLYVQPGAKKSEVVGPFGDRLKIRIHAPPVDGKANKEVLRFISEVLGTKDLEIIRGDLSRNKDIYCPGLDVETCRIRLDTVK